MLAHCKQHMGLMLCLTQPECGPDAFKIAKKDRCTLIKDLETGDPYGGDIQGLLSYVKKNYSVFEFLLDWLLLISVPLWKRVET